MSTPAILMSFRVARWDDEPFAENAMVLPPASFSDLIGESALTYQ